MFGEPTTTPPAQGGAARNAVSYAAASLVFSISLAARFCERGGETRGGLVKFGARFCERTGATPALAEASG
jgi:hypothetical protein